MATTTDVLPSEAALPERRALEGSPAGSLRHDWTMAGLSVIFTSGFALDTWAHNHGEVDDTFFTPWHAFLYSGVVLSGIFLLWTAWRNIRKGYPWRRSVARGYGLSLFGVGLFLWGGLFDLLWHSIFGFEVSVEALLSPAHLILALAGVLIVTGPVRAVWLRLRDEPAQTWTTLGPLVIAATLLLTIFSLFTQYAHPLVETLAAVDDSAVEVLDDIYVMNTDGSGQTRLTVNPERSHWGPAWSPDGTRMALTIGDPDGTGQLYTMNADGSGPRQITNNGRSNYLPAWSPDGGTLSFISQEGHEGETAEVFVVGADGTGEKRLTNNAAQEYGTGWSPDGKKIVFGSRQDGTWQLYTMNPDGSGQALLPSDGGGNAPAWSPDGTRIAFTSNRTGNDSIYVMDAAGGNVRRLTVDDYHNDNAAWSPDGTQIAYGSWRDGSNGIYAMSAAGSEPRNLTNNPGMESFVPSWSPDGKIAYTARGRTGEPNTFLNQALGAASILLQSALLVGIILLLVSGWTLPLGALTLLFAYNGIAMVVQRDHQAYLPGVIAAGIIADLLLWRLKPTVGQPLRFYAFALLVPLVFYVLYFTTMQLTTGIGWTVHLWMGAIVLAGVVGLLVSFLIVPPLRARNVMRDA